MLVLERFWMWLSFKAVTLSLQPEEEKLEFFSYIHFSLPSLLSLPFFLSSYSSGVPQSGVTTTVITTESVRSGIATLRTVT